MRPFKRSPSPQKDHLMKSSNKHETREGWLKQAALLLRPHFTACGYDLPDNMRFSIGFPSTGRKGKRVGELWHASTSADGSFELFIRADISDPPEVLGILVHELVHAVLPPDAGHGKPYRDAAHKIGLQGKMREAMPGALLTTKLVDIAESLGPLPHARLHIERGATDKGPADRPKKQGTRLLKAICEHEGCGYTVRITAKWVDDLGPPICPKHDRLTVESTPADTDEPAHAEPESETV